jgi:hypothetical protein
MHTRVELLQLVVLTEYQRGYVMKDEKQPGFRLARHNVSDDEMTEAGLAYEIHGGNNFKDCSALADQSPPKMSHWWHRQGRPVGLSFQDALLTMVMSGIYVFSTEMILNRYNSIDLVSALIFVFEF